MNPRNPLEKFPAEYYELFRRVLFSPFAEVHVEIPLPSKRKAEQLRQSLHAFRRALRNCPDSDLELAEHIDKVRIRLIDYTREDLGWVLMFDLWPEREPIVKYVQEALKGE